MKTAVTTTLIAAAALCAALMAAGILCCGALLSLINTPEEIMADSRLYLDIYIWGLPFLFFYNIATGIFSALGDSRTPFLFLAVSSTANIAVDILFVTAFDMGVAGVAWATFLCQGVSCVLAMAVVFRRLAGIKTEGKAPLFSAPMLGRVVAIAVPSILQQSFISVGNIVIQSVINSFGAGVIAGYAAAVKLNNLVITSLTTLGNGVSNYTAQNIGAGKPERVRQGFAAGARLVWMICVPLALAYFLAGRWLLRLFMDEPTGTAVSTGVTFLRILSPFYFVVSVKLVADGILRGAGMMRKFMASTFTDLILRVALALALSQTALGATGIWLPGPSAGASPPCCLSCSAAPVRGAEAGKNRRSCPSPDRGLSILSFEKESIKGNFLRETAFRVGTNRFTPVRRRMRRGVFGRGKSLCSLPVHEGGQQKAVTHLVCNGFLPGTEYEKERFG